MKKPEEGDAGYGPAGGRRHKREASLASSWLTPERVLLAATVTTTLCFLGHIAFLVKIGPPARSMLTRTVTYAYSSIPLVVGALSLLIAILAFRKIQQKTTPDLVVLIIALIFGSLTIHGLIGFTMHMLRQWYGVWG